MREVPKGLAALRDRESSRTVENLRKNYGAGTVVLTTANECFVDGFDYCWKKLEGMFITLEEMGVENPLRLEDGDIKHKTGNSEETTGPSSPSGAW